MQAYVELSPPTAVSNATALSFLGPKAHNLAVARTSLLQIFELKSVVTEVCRASGDGPATDPATSDYAEPADLLVQRTEHTSKLVLVAEYPLQGIVLGLVRINALDTRSGGDALLIAFRDAKMSLIEWDPATHALSTVSIHYYEGQGLQEAPWDAGPGQQQSLLVVDPSSRCAALKFGARYLAILPFRQLGDGLGEGDGYDPVPDEPANAHSNKEKMWNYRLPKAPYQPSFTLSLPQIDPALTHPVHLDFLYEYREPTFGIIAGNMAAAASLLHERRDTLTYTVFTLDLEERASTALLSVTGLPSDTFKVVPLPLPVGGALLLGANQFIHVDQAGKTNAVAVNDFALRCSSFPMTDQSGLAMRLEGAFVEPLSSEGGDLLVISRDGSLAIISFKLDGRIVSGLSISRVTEDRGGFIFATAASCTASLGRHRMFIGSEDGDSSLLGWTQRTPQLSRKRSHAEVLDLEGDVLFQNGDLEDDDDLYGDDQPTARADTATAESSDPGNYTFRIHHTLTSLAPINDATLASRRIPDTTLVTPGNVAEQVDLVLSTGRGRAGGLAVVKRDIDPVIISKAGFSNARAVWSVHARRPAPNGMVAAGQFDAEARLAADVDYDQYLVVSRTTTKGEEETTVLNITPDGFKETFKGDFMRKDAMTINVGTVAGGTRIVQVLKTEIRGYDSELDLDQIIPMDNENGDELGVISVSFADPYVLVLRDDSSVVILQANPQGEVEGMDRGDALLSTKWLSGCIYQTPTLAGQALVYLLSTECALHIFALPDLSKPAYVAACLAFLPPMLTADYMPRRSSAKAELSEILVADIGDSTSRSTYLIIRTSCNELAIYQPYHFPVHETGHPFTENLRWLKVPQPRLPESSEDAVLDVEELASDRESILTQLPNVDGYSVAFMAGTSPSFILKESTSLPRVLRLRTKSVKNLTSFHTPKCERGFACINTDGNLYVCQLPPGYRYGGVGWAVHKVPMGQDIQALCYHPTKDAFVLGVGEKEAFTLSEDEHHQEWLEEDITFKPMVEHGAIKMVDAQTMDIIDTYELDATEIVLTVKILNLEVSEVTRERNQMVAVGTGFILGEDLPARGRIYVFNIINVVPKPGQAQTNRKLKLVAMEEVRGPVTAVTNAGSEGFLLMTQGQKCMVRGLKEDGTLLPVAFMDLQCYVTVAKELGESGLLLIGDAAKGVWLVGYTEDPYKLILFGKSRSDMGVMAAEFLPHDKDLHLIVADADGDLHALEYDPAHPKSLSGQRLLYKAAFHTGHYATTMTLLPSLLSPAADSTSPDEPPSRDAMDLDGASPPQGAVHHILITTLSGSLALLTPVTEQQYRRLSMLQTFLASTSGAGTGISSTGTANRNTGAGLEHWCGLNPRDYRTAAEMELAGCRSMVDGTLLARWQELGSQRQADGAAKLGVDEWIVRSDLGFIAGAGVAYL